jgi:hypothetical protein
MTNEKEPTIKNPPLNMADMLKVENTQALPNNSDLFQQARDIALKSLEPIISDLASKIQIQLMEAYCKYSNNPERNKPISGDLWTCLETFNPPVLKTDIRILKDLLKWVCEEFIDVTVTVVPKDVARFKEEGFEE